ncbi:DUF563 domain-containing protein [Chroococcidiopsis sp. CCNUC1]|uniref:glycosyltransferase family 61 protein n=1 Tax=Chroococcidiopsis sp. CCNUC1 TaxID=2653189 RepID=UPI00202089B6|nr:glycosyltransferase family 61 protein [Chroococcidiopsis sp. CCNUC1]URD51127.1 glycosyltransferase family 61 protein [Chroococcidiopsis sp. CCNUC1]
MRILEKISHKSNLTARKYLTNLLVHEVKLEEHYKNSQRENLSCSGQNIYIPETQQMNFFREIKHLQAANYSLPDIYTTTLHDVIYCTKFDILLTKTRKVISDSINTTIEQNKYDIAENTYFNKTEKIAGVCAIFRSFANGYYHQLIDNIPRIFLLDRPQYKDIEEIKLLASTKISRSEEFLLSKILPNNVKLTKVSPDKNYAIENLIFPSFLTRRHAGYLPSDYLRFFTEKVTPQRPRKKINRIFISRKASKKGRHILNEDELFDMLSKYGFKKYLLEQISIEDQIDLFSDSEYVIGSHGAGLANIIFAEGVNVLEIFPTQEILPHFYFLAKSLNHNYEYWCGQATSKNSNFVVNVSEIARMIASQEMCPT